MSEQTKRWTKKNVNTDIFMWIFYMITFSTKKKRVESESERKRDEMLENNDEIKRVDEFINNKRRKTNADYTYKQIEKRCASKDTNIRSIEQQRTICVSRTFSSYIRGFLLLVTHSRLREPFNSMRFVSIVCDILAAIIMNLSLYYGCRFSLLSSSSSSMSLFCIFFFSLHSVVAVFNHFFLSRCSVVDSFCQL